jgi:hypothetical protein
MDVLLAAALLALSVSGCAAERMAPAVTVTGDPGDRNPAYSSSASAVKSVQADELEVSRVDPLPSWTAVDATWGPTIGAAWLTDATVDLHVSDPIAAWVDAADRRGSVLVWVVGPRAYTGDVEMRRLRLPATLDQGYCLQEEYESQPAPGVAWCTVNGWVDDPKLVNINVWIDGAATDTSVRRAVDAQLARLRLDAG